MDQEIDHISTLLRRTFEGSAWHGPSVREALKDIKSTEVYTRIGGTHNIIELVNHMVAWRTYVAKKLAGDADYKVSDEVNFGVPGDWTAAVMALEQSQRDLQQTLTDFSDARLFDQVPGVREPLTFYTLLHSSIHHDLYHTGQIVLIRKAQQSI